METLIVRLGQLAMSSLLLTAFCGIGCTTWQASLDPPSATKASGSSVSRMSADLQRILLLQAVHNLNADFNRINNGAEWKKHLQLETIQSLLNQPNNVPPDKATRERLIQISSRFEAIADNNDYKVIYELSSFRTVQAALPEFAIDPVVRHGRLIAANLQLLSEELDGFSYGDGWKRFLKLDELTELTRSPQALARADRNALIETLTLFEQTTENPEFVAIASAAGFHGAMRGLEQLVGDLRTDTHQIARPDGASKLDLDPRRYHVVELTSGESVVIDRSSGQRVADLRQPFAASQRGGDESLGTDKRLEHAEPDARPEPPTPATTATGRVASTSKLARPSTPVAPAADSAVREQGNVMPQSSLPSTPDATPDPTGVYPQSKSPSRQVSSVSDHAAVNLSFVPESLRTEAIPRERSRPKAERSQNSDRSRSTTPTSEQAAMNLESVSMLPPTTKPGPLGPKAQDQPRSTQKQVAPQVPSDKVRYVRDVKNELRAHLDELENVINEVDDDARVRVETIDRIPEYRPGRRLVTVWKRRSFSRVELADHLAALRARYKQANIDTQPSDVEPPADQQRQTELMQRIETALRILHEAAGAR